MEITEAGDRDRLTSGQTNVRPSVIGGCESVKGPADWLGLRLGVVVLVIVAVTIVIVAMIMAVTMIVVVVATRTVGMLVRGDLFANLGHV